MNEKHHTLDKIDKKVLLELQINARQPISSISKKTRIPRNVVKYRIDRLEKTGIIKGYAPLINTSLLGYNLYVYVGFSVINMNPEKEKEFLAFLVAHKNITYVAKNSGKWDFSVGICAKDYLHFDEILHEIRNRFNSIIKDFDVSPVVKDFKYDWVADLV